MYYIRHLARNPLNKSQRVSGVRRMRFQFSSGRHFKMRGQRSMEIAPEDLKKEADAIEAGILGGLIEVLEDDRVLDLEEVKGLAGPTKKVDRPIPAPSDPQPEAFQDDPPEAIPEGATEIVPEDQYREELKSHSRSELNRLAEEIGLDPTQHSKKADLIEAIIEHQRG